MVSVDLPMNVIVARSLMKGYCVLGYVILAAQLFDEIVEGIVVSCMVFFFVKETKLGHRN